MDEEDQKNLDGGLHALFEVLQVGSKMGGENLVMKELEQTPGFF